MLTAVLFGLVVVCSGYATLSVLRLLKGAAGAGLIVPAGLATLAIVTTWLSAVALPSPLRGLGLESRAGLHTGECERVDGKLGGMAVHIGARVCALASAGQVLVTSTVKDLVIGSGLQFEDRGRHTLKGVPGEWQLFALAE